MLRFSPTYGLSRTDRAALLELTEVAGLRSLADELAWVTAHKFRKTTATILAGAGQTPTQVADQLGHADTSTTIDDYFGRRAKNPEAAKVLDRELRSIHEDVSNRRMALKSRDNSRPRKTQSVG
ncbi:tyrosine-type recombinase/integrase [Kribbella sp. CA-294648]|uniref:tyrosine-type recombinase/integrase n=1 Tax=Kribbella sp. CA-294648 TaxID=3239948 RepID=UPI003D8E8EB7